jgi:hypothetical protein
VFLKKLIVPNRSHDPYQTMSNPSSEIPKNNTSPVIPYYCYEKLTNWLLYGGQKQEYPEIKYHVVEETPVVETKQTPQTAQTQQTTAPAMYIPSAPPTVTSVEPSICNHGGVQYWGTGGPTWSY